jgi:creatinine amidohydrolase
MTRLAELTWEQAQERAAGDALLLVPVGSTEQHGPHLPLSTDTDIAVAIAERAAGRLAGAIVAPAVAYGSSGEHQDFAGTLSIGQTAVEQLLIELVRSAGASFRRVALVSTHGGNLESASRARDVLRAEGREVLLWTPPWRGDAHAGRTETALMLAIDPARVHTDQVAAGNTTPIHELIGELREHGVRYAAANGVLGDPHGASPAEGRELLEQAVDDLLSQVQMCSASRS